MPAKADLSPARMMSALPTAAKRRDVEFGVGCM
jgi:hypothetical protein